MKSTSIIIPNYNGEEILAQNLPIILQYTQKYHSQIIIVDDKSTDNSVSMLKKNFPQVTLIEKPTNQGFSSTVNRGVQNATTELVCLLNSDIIATENFLDPILPRFDDENLAAVGMLDESDDNDTHGRGKFFFQKGFILHQKLQEQGKDLESGKTGWVSCGSGVFSKKIWDKLGGLDELLNPFYFEDVDYGYRAWKSGYKMYFDSSAIVKHIHKKGAIKTHYQEEKIKTISYRNQIYVSATNLTDKDLYSQFLSELPKNIAIAIKNNDRPFLRAIKEAMTHLNKIKQSREKKKALFQKTDTEVIKMSSL